MAETYNVENITFSLTHHISRNLRWAQNMLKESMTASFKYTCATAVEVDF